MSASFSQRFWSLFQPAHKAYQRAYTLHEKFNAQIRLDLMGPTEEQIREARRTPSLHEAEILYQEAQERSASQNLAFNVAVAIYQRALLYRLLGRWPEAATGFRDALDQFETLVGDHPAARDGLRLSHHLLGQALLRSQRCEEAMQHLQTARRLHEALGDRAHAEAARKLLEESASHATECRRPPIEAPAGEGQSTASAHWRPSHHSRPSNTAWPSSGTIPIVLVATFTRSAAEELISQIQREWTSSAARPINLVTVAFTEPQSAPRITTELRQSGPCAVVIALEREGLKNEEYLSLLKRSIRQVARRDAFRLYVAPHDLVTDPEDSEADELLTRLEDTVQRADSVETLCQNLRAFAENLETIRKREAWRNLCLLSTGVAGAVATDLQAASLALALALVFWLPVWDPQATLEQYAGFEWFAALACGVAAVPFLNVVLHVFTRHGIPPVGLWRDRRSAFWWGWVAAVVGPHALGVPIRLHAPAGYLVLGVALGLVLDGARRRGYGAKRQRLVVLPDRVAGRHGRLRPELRRQAGPAWINPWTCPLLPAESPRVFISYARASPWGCACAKELETELSKVGATYFRDTALPEGGAWRRELNAHLGRANVLVALADEITVERAWPAAEVEAALAGRALTGAPAIVAVRSPTLPEPSEETWRWLPVFRAVLADEQKDGETRPEVMEYSEVCAQAIAFKLHPRAYRSVAVYPVWLAKLVSSLWSWPRLALQLWGLLGVPVAIAGIIVVFVGDLLLGADSGTWLSERGWLAATVLGCAALCGHWSRLTLAAGFQLRHERAMSVMRFQLSVALVMLGLLGWWGRRSGVLVQGWALLLCCAAFLAADHGCREGGRGQPDFIGPADY